MCRNAGRDKEYQQSNTWRITESKDVDKPNEHRLYKTLIMMSVVVYHTARIETHYNQSITGRKGERVLNSLDCPESGRRILL